MRYFAVLIILIFAAACSKDASFDPNSGPAQALSHCNKLLEDKAYDAAETCLENLQATFPGTNTSTIAELRVADLAFARKEYLIAAESYRNFTKLYPAHPKLPYVYYRAGLCYLEESPKSIARDQQYLDDALAFFEVGLRYFPGSAYTEDTKKAYREARRRIGARHLYVGKLYYKKKEFQAAIPRFAEVSDNFQDLGLDEEALYLMAKSYLVLEQRQGAVASTVALKERFPESQYVSKLIKELNLN